MYEKASRADHEPIQEQLELQKPGEWTPFQMSAYLRRQRSSANDSLFVEQDDDDDDNDDDTRINSPSAQLLNSTAFEPNSPVLSNAAFERQPPTSSVKLSQTDTVPLSPKIPTGPRFLTSPQKPFRVNSRELGKKSDVLCWLIYGSDKTEVGEVSVCNSSDSARRTMFTTKNKQQRIDLSFDELCSLDHYRDITKDVKTPFNSQVLLLIK
jgi:hypothetical protein